MARQRRSVKESVAELEGLQTHLPAVEGESLGQSSHSMLGGGVCSGTHRVAGRAVSS